MNLAKTIEEEYENIQADTLQELQSKSSDKIVSNLLEKCIEFVESKRTDGAFSSHGRYFHALDIVRKEEYTAEDILAFSVFLTDLSKSILMYKFSVIGLFCSALISAHYEKTNREKNVENKKAQMYHLWTVDHKQKMNELCFKNNGPHVTITGNVGNNFAMWMNDGEIHLHGNAETYAGSAMSGGKIYLESCMRNLGNSMSGGEIIVNHAGESVGSFQWGGKIEIQKTYKTIETLRNSKGEIYFQGKRIK